MTTKWFSIGAAEQWGDYWRIIIAGLSVGRHHGQMQLHRTGPFVPPLTVVGMDEVIVTEEMRKILGGTAGIKGFQPVIKEKIIYLDWSQWHLGGDEPHLLQFSEPESVLGERNHDSQLAAKIGDLFEVLLEQDGIVDESYDDNGDLVVTFLEPPNRGHDFFKADTVGGFGVVIGTDVFVETLTSDTTKWLEITPIQG